MHEDADPPPARILASCVEAGNDDVRLNGLELGFQSQSSLLALARDYAWDDALAKAEQYAGLALRTLGAVLEITEDVVAPGPHPMTMAMKSVHSTLPIERGESEVAVDIRVRWRLI